MPPEIGQLTNLKGLRLVGSLISDVPLSLRHVCFWNNLLLPPDFFPVSAWTAERILNETNAEVRRVMLERYGEARFIEELGAEPVHKLPTTRSIAWTFPVMKPW